MKVKLNYESCSSLSNAKMPKRSPGKSLWSFVCGRKLGWKLEIHPLSARCFQPSLLSLLCKTRFLFQTSNRHWTSWLVRCPAARFLPRALKEISQGFRGHWRWSQMCIKQSKSNSKIVLKQWKKEFVQMRKTSLLKVHSILISDFKTISVTDSSCWVYIS